jgi:hypothetical protein
MAIAVLSAFVLGWLAAAAALVMLAVLSVRLSRRNRLQNLPVSQRLFADLGWPFSMLRTDAWSEPQDRRLAGLARASIIAAAALLVFAAIARSLVIGR